MATLSAGVTVRSSEPSGLVETVVVFVFIVTFFVLTVVVLVFLVVESESSSKG